MKVLMKFYLILLTISLSYDCGNQNPSQSSDIALEPKVDKYTTREYSDMINSCNDAIKRFSQKSSVSNQEQTKSQLQALSVFWYSIYGKTVPAKIDSTRSDYIAIRDSAMNVLGRYQEKMFPKYRETFANYAKQLLWEADCSANVEGERNEILVLTGSYFLPNANKKQSYETLKNAVEKYRFKKLRFKWYESDDDFFDYDIRSDNDKDYISIGDF